MSIAFVEYARKCFPPKGENDLFHHLMQKQIVEYNQATSRRY